MPRLTLVKDIDLRLDARFDGVTLGSFGANSWRTERLLMEMGRNEVVFVRGRDPGRGRLILDLMGIRGVMIVKVPKGAKYSIGLALREALRRIAGNSAIAKRLVKEAEEYRNKINR